MLSSSIQEYDKFKESNNGSPLQSVPKSIPLGWQLLKSIFVRNGLLLKIIVRIEFEDKSFIYKIIITTI